MKLSAMIYADGITKSKQIKFGGLNKSLGAEDGELVDMKNLTGNHAPLIATRAPRYKRNIGEDPGGIFWHGALCFTVGTDFYYDWEVKGQVEKGRKTFCAMGAYVVIFPDKRYYNIKTGEFGEMESAWSGNDVTFSNGTIYGEPAAANTIKCEGADWSSWFRVGDTVFIEGCEKYPENNVSIIIREIEGDTLRFSENSFTLPESGTCAEDGEIRLTRKVPDLKYLCENENRLWGCTEDEIFCSKQRDIFNWYTGDGLGDDSWNTGVGSVGSFTGCFAYKGFPTFFKEDHIYKVYGSLSTEFQALGSATLGLAENSGNSLAVAGETLFYLSRTGITAFTGGVPQPVGDNFGTMRFCGGAASSDGLKYYVSLEEENGEQYLYTYDTQTGLWHKEDACRAIGFTRWDGCVAMLEEDGTLSVLNAPPELPDGFVQEGQVEWMAEFADFTEGDPNKKRIGKLQLRLELETGAWAQAYLQTDSDGIWRPVGTRMQADVKRSCYLPITPRRCDHYRVRIEGAGGCKIYSMVREVSAGSELKSKSGRN